MSYTIKEAATIMGVSTMTIRRYIKDGKLKASLAAGKHGEEYKINAIPEQHIPSQVSQSPQTERENLRRMVETLISKSDQLNIEVGYWRGKYEELNNQVKLLQAPKHTKPWYRRLLPFAK